MVVNRRTECANTSCVVYICRQASVWTHEGSALWSYYLPAPGTLPVSSSSRKKFCSRSIFLTQVMWALNTAGLLPICTWLCSFLVMILLSTILFDKHDVHTERIWRWKVFHILIIIIMVQDNRVLIWVTLRLLGSPWGYVYSIYIKLTRPIYPNTPPSAV